MSCKLNLRQDHFSDSLSEKQNKGWKAISAKKVGKDPKSRSWQVTMTQGNRILTCCRDDV